ncbi:hypothetical protein V1514DRAFT_323671 [Lipomyces japonicus]|uniref:uncharacterized protein n=1 Tax=Lipomyces japonicus TaxID=56871 RepID=UPI0034CE7658
MEEASVYNENPPFVHVNYSSLPAASSTSNEILATDIYTYQPVLQDHTGIDVISSTMDLQNKLQPVLGVVIAHPYPPLGGSKNDPVVRYFARKLIQKFQYEAVVYAFNFKGVTTRTSWTSKSEQQDLSGVISALTQSYPLVRTVLIVGYSYGAMIASKIDSSSFASEGVRFAYMLLSPVLWPATVLLTMSFMASQGEPQIHQILARDLENKIEPPEGGKVLVVHGTKDSFTRTNRYDKWIEKQYRLIIKKFGKKASEAIKSIKIKDGQHNWSKEELEDLWKSDAVQAFLDGLLKDAKKPTI